MNGDLEKFNELHAVIFPILVDNEQGAKRLELSCDECKIPIYFDQKKAVVQDLHQEVIVSKLGRMPAVIIADMDGMIRYAYFGESMADIPPNQELMDVLRNLDK